MTRATTTRRKGLPRPARFWAALAVLAGVALVTAMGAMITVALPGLAGSFGASDADVVWTVTCYQMASMACVLPAASLAGTFGDRIIFLTGLLLYRRGLTPLRSLPGPRHAHGMPCPAGRWRGRLHGRQPQTHRDHFSEQAARTRHRA